ncbi:hypothetical protein [Cohnella cholangitidis]|uniref:Uncharacterized protein n=1 Tax=Cohnella cholangitidis TaxID=2598458 RepID=A0A7G5BU58_9BACL|nr:hypothetical protein [Cohnella cholangitidis]QMV40492.1 hypothetical protein FPL14_04190 [Cohnella cholangitidis]
MGGKTKILDPKQIRELYSVSRAFDQRATSSMQTIHKRLAQIIDPAFQSGAFSDHYAEARNAIIRVAEEIAAAKSSLESTSKFVEEKLAGAAYLAKDDPGDASIDCPTGSIPYDVNLKK